MLTMSGNIIERSGKVRMTYRVTIYRPNQVLEKINVPASGIWREKDWWCWWGIGAANRKMEILWKSLRRVSSTFETHAECENGDSSESVKGCSHTDVAVWEKIKSNHRGWQRVSGIMEIRLTGRERSRYSANHSLCREIHSYRPFSLPERIVRRSSNVKVKVITSSSALVGGSKSSFVIELTSLSWNIMSSKWSEW